MEEEKFFRSLIIMNAMLIDLMLIFFERSCSKVSSSSNKLLQYDCILYLYTYINIFQMNSFHRFFFCLFLKPISPISPLPIFLSLSLFLSIS